MGNPFNKQPAPTNENSNWCDSFDDYSNPNLPNAFCSEKKMTDSKFRSNKNSPSIKRLGPKDYSKEGYKTKEICALIITINENDSYDALYQTIEQTPPDPTKFVSVYQFSYGALLALYQLHFEYKTPSFDDSCLETIHNPPRTSSSTPPSYSPDIIEVLKEVKEEMNKLDGENIVINFECCGSCSDAGFCEPFSSQVLSITKSFLQRNYVVMFSDFSLKALIKEWNYFDADLGSNPFYKVGEFGTKHVLRFNSQDLIDCDFAQLQNVGELCEKGRAEINALDGTILYSVKKEFFTKNVNEKNQKEESLFDLKVLTVNEDAEGLYYGDSEHSIPIIDKEGKEVRGLAGHVVLNYKNGGKILASCGHWVELIKLDVTKEGLLAHAEKNYGMEYAKNLEQEIDSYSCEEDRMEKIRFTANSEVQKKAPCRYKSYD